MTSEYVQKPFMLERSATFRWGGKSDANDDLCVADSQNAEKLPIRHPQDSVDEAMAFVAEANGESGAGAGDGEKVRGA